MRVFLAAYMIALRPSYVFEQMGSLEKALYEVAGTLIPLFERILEEVIQKGAFDAVSDELTKDFPTLMFEYLKNFKAWKIPDEAKLTCRIKHALIALYESLDALPHDEPVDSPLKKEFESNIVRLRSKLSDIAGPQKLAEFDEDRRKGMVGEPARATSTNHNPSHSSSSGTVVANYQARATTEQLAHELLLDPLFQLDDRNESNIYYVNPVHHRIRETFHKVYHSYYFIHIIIIIIIIIIIFFSRWTQQQLFND